MKIIKLPDALDPKVLEKQNALKGCDKCPCCGETRQLFFSEKEGTKGIAGGLERTWRKGIFNIKIYYSTVFTCYTCGAQWESEPYTYT